MKSKPSCWGIRSDLNEHVIRPESTSNADHGARDWRRAHDAAVTRGSHDAAAPSRA